MAELRVFLADDHAVVRDGLKALIEARPGMSVVGEAGDGEAALAGALEMKPDVVVADVSMPRMNGARLAEELRERAPDVKLLALTVHEDRAYLRQLLGAGARGYVLKRAPADELFLAIDTVASGGLYVDPTLAGHVVGSFVRTGAEAHPEVPLSERETEVLQLISKGYSNREVAEKLGLSTKTVETYKARSLEKLGFASRADIVRYAIAQGWLQSC